MRRYFITGGTGFIGSELVSQLLDREDTESVMCLTRGRRPVMQHRKLVYWTADMVSGMLPKHGYTDVIHAACDLSLDGWRGFYEAVEGSRRVAELIAECAPERWTLVSSGAAALADDFYGKAKKVSESLFGSGLKIARVYALFGETAPLNGGWAFGNYVRQALEDRRQIKVMGDGRNVRSYLHVSDAARWILAVHDRGRSSFPYAIGGSEEITMFELAQRIALYAGASVVINGGEDKGRRRYVPGVSLLEHTKQFLEVEETISLNEGLRSCIDHVRNTYLEPSRAA